MQMHVPDTDHQAFKRMVTVDQVDKRRERNLVRDQLVGHLVLILVLLLAIIMRSSL